jgi:hypothetical protein
LNSFNSALKSINPSNFDEIAIEVYNYQAVHCPVFRQYLSELGKTSPIQSLDEMVFLPIEFFKTHAIKTGDWEPETVFESSGTTGVQTSRHYIRSLSNYKESTQETFEQFYGALNEFTILALLPSYLERGNSGLIAMVDGFIQRSNSKDSGFYLDEFDLLHNQLVKFRNQDKKTLLWGVTFALLDFAAEWSGEFPELIVMETGGMKGRRAELPRSEVHETLKTAFGVETVHSEYGMTELNSQAYSKGKGIFEPSKSMKIIVRDLNDPFELRAVGKTGALNIIDLENLDSCSFIETKDLGRVYKDGSFEVMGRMDNSDVRGCNLMVL